MQNSVLAPGRLEAGSAPGSVASVYAFQQQQYFAVSREADRAQRKQPAVPCTVFSGDSFRATLFLLRCSCAVNHFRKHRAVKRTFIYS